MMNITEVAKSESVNLWVALAQEMEDQEMLELAGVIERPWVRPDDLDEGWE